MQVTDYVHLLCLMIYVLNAHFLQRDRRSREDRLLAGLRRLQYPHLDELPSIDSILEAGKLRYQLLEWLFWRYVSSTLHIAKRL